MNYEFSKSFSRQFRQIKSKELALSVIAVVEFVSEAKTAGDIPNIRKMKGHKTAFRIRVGDYRIGVFIESNTVYFASFAHRKEIYKSFP
jgi:mRNA interferase RelE/StbE